MYDYTYFIKRYLLKNFCKDEKNSFRNLNRNNYKQAWRKVVNKGAFRIFAVPFHKKNGLKKLQTTLKFSKRNNIWVE